MTTFLEYVARDVISKYGHDLSRLAVVFPNKRAALFFNEHLARMAQKPIWSPSYITISEFFQRHSNLHLADPIKLICELHRCYAECTGTDETLDHFYGWGQLLLTDFDDIDKNMADAKAVFTNLRDLHELDDVSYLDSGQVESIRKFFSNFSEDHNTELKRRFITLWSNIYNIYKHFNSRLEAQGIAYEGALYRRVATADTLALRHDTYLFVGFNVLQKVEQELFKRLQRQGRAKFYWDFDHYYMPRKGSREPNNEAGHYIAAYLGSFPNELDITDNAIYNNFSSSKDITFISAPTENIQARYISTWLRQNNRIAAGPRTAIVLCNEGLLPTVIHSLPDEVEKVNITTGYPLAQTPIASLLTLLITLHTAGYTASTDCYRLHNVNALLRHPYIKYISENYRKLYKQLNIDTKTYHPNRQQLAIDEGFGLLFSDINADPAMPPAARIAHWTVSMVEHIAANARQTTDPLFQESLFRAYTLTKRLAELIATGDLTIDTITLQRLVNQLVKSTTIPFHGEPVVGTQVMGVLETRNLDFDHLLILSANEGNMPKGVNDTSFIPHTIRKAHLLTTIDNKVAIYAYYFHRLLQRASDITIVYNNSTDNGTTGEMSRFMLQIMAESPHNIVRKTLQAGHATTASHRIPAEKTDNVMRKLLDRFDTTRNQHQEGTPLLTPTAINRYIRCPKQFFYNYVCGIKEPQNDNEDQIDSRVFGNIFHESAQLIYESLRQKDNRITATSIKSMLDAKGHIERIVDQTFKKELFKTDDRETKLRYNGLQLINREVIITYLRKLLQTDAALAPFTIVGLESDVMETLSITTGKHSFETTIGGRIDRLDSMSDGAAQRIRVVDYKTGNRPPKVFENVAALFDPANIRHHSDYYLQTFIYSMLVRRSTLYNSTGLAVSPALLFIQHAAEKDYDPTLKIAGKPVTDIAQCQEEFEAILKVKVNEIFDSEIPFTPTENQETCEKCPYRQICNAER